MTKEERLMYVEQLRQQQLMNSGCGTPVLYAIIIAGIMLFSSCATKTKIEYRDRDVVKYNTSYVHDTPLWKSMIVYIIQYSKREIRFMIQNMLRGQDGETI